jgi:cytoskeletal protein RodZ
MNIGAQLRAAREAKGLSIDALAATTRVQPRIITAIERNDVAAVPPRPFGRGFVRAYAREVGLDPDQTAREYFAQFAPAPESHTDGPPTPKHSRHNEWSATHWMWPVAAAALVILVVSVVSLSTSDNPTAERGSPAPIGTSGSSAAAATAVADKGGQPSKAATAAGQVQPTAGLTVVLVAERKCWVTANADGRRAVYRLLAPGTRETLRAEREITIRTGDAGALTWTINGRDAGTLGRPGQVRDVRITPKNAGSIK